MEPSPVVRIKRKHVSRLSANEEKIRAFFGVELEVVVRTAPEEPLGASVVCYKVVPVVVVQPSSGSNVRKEDTGTLAGEGANSEELAKRVQVRGQRES